MPTDKRQEKLFKKKLKALETRMFALVRKGESFHREAAALHTLIAKQRLLDAGIESEDIKSFTKILELEEDSPLESLDVATRLIGAADCFSHLKSVELAGVANWVRLTEGLLIGFLLTDLKGTTAEDIRMPLPSFIIELPPGSVYTYDYETGFHETQYVIVSEAVSPIQGDTLFIYSWSAPNENSEHIFDDHAEFFPLSLSHGKESLADVIDFYDKMREEEAKEKGASPFISGRDAVGKIFGEEYYGNDFREKLLRVVINTIIYMTSDSAVVEHENQDEIDKLSALKERGKLKMKGQKTLEQLENTPRFILGTDITITHSDLEAIKKAQKDDRNRGKSGRKLAHPSITRGHWRWQRHGPKLALVKRIWIKPFIRGKELGGEGGGHTYVLKNPFDLEDDFCDQFAEV